VRGYLVPVSRFFSSEKALELARRQQLEGRVSLGVAGLEQAQKTHIFKSYWSVALK
jgi:hypothetical protein